MSDDDTRSEVRRNKINTFINVMNPQLKVSEILASCDNTSPKKKEGDGTSETSSDPFEV